MNTKEHCRYIKAKDVENFEAELGYETFGASCHSVIVSIYQPVG